VAVLNRLDEEHTLALLGFDANAIVYECGIRGRSRAGQKLPLRRRWAHGFLACSIPADSKSGQFKVRATFDKPQFWPLFRSMSGYRWRFDSIQIPAGVRCMCWERKACLR